MIIRKHAYARVGLVGNPSDMYFGKTIAAAIRNFACEVMLWESPRLELRPHPTHDSTRFDSLAQLVDRVHADGYYGGLRLLFAACKRFREYCSAMQIRLDGRNFSIAYDTTIPRQVGLGGSSAIITATIRALMEFFGIQEEVHIPKAELPNLILSVETDELGITAGLQDRVVQVYGGVVFMDFAEATMIAQGHGDYSYIDATLLPPLFLAYTHLGSESGKVHNDVRYRYEAGDADVVAAMREFAEYARAARQAILDRDHDTLGSLFNMNFDLRRRIFTDKAIGEQDLEMVEIARSRGCPAKLSGSRGAVVGICRDPDLFEALEEAYVARGYGFTRLAVDAQDDTA